MAFEILTEEQKELLTPSQLIQYERHLKIYEQRVDFVKKLEKFENIEYMPYSLRKVQLTKTNKVDVSNVKISERKITAKNNTSHKISGYKLFNKIDSDERKTEVKVTLENIKIRDRLGSIADTFDQTVPVMPQTNLTKDKIKEIKCIVPFIEKAELPKAALKNIPDKISETPDTASNISIPQAKISGVNNKPVKQAEFTYSVPKRKCVDVNTPEIKSANVNQVSIEKFNISKIPDISDKKIPVNMKPDFNFNAVDVNHPDICPVLSVNKFEKKKYTVNEVPVPTAKINFVDKPEIPAAKLKTDGIKNTAPEKPYVRKYKNPDIRLKSANTKVPVIKKTNINIPTAKIDNTPGAAIPDLPDIKAGNMPCTKINGISGLKRPDTEKLKQKLKMS